jgi:signal transduction histidine kinase
MERLRATNWPVDLDHLDEEVLATIAALPETERESLFRWLLAVQLDSPRRGSAEAHDTAHRALEIGEARERTRVARELHDSLGGDLAAAIALFKYYFENPTRSRAAGEVVLHNIQDILELSMRNLRAMLRSMRSHEIGARGLVGDLMDIAEAYRRNHGMDVALDTIGSEEELSQTQQEVVFQVVREALSNVRRHSGSVSCLVKLNFAGQPFVVEVTDHGVGITDPSPDGYGLVGMRERAAGIGGRLQVVSASGRGTTIFLFGPQQPVH